MENLILIEALEYYNEISIAKFIKAAEKSAPLRKMIANKYSAAKGLVSLGNPKYKEFANLKNIPNLNKKDLEVENQLKNRYMRAKEAQKILPLIPLDPNTSITALRDILAKKLEQNPRLIFKLKPEQIDFVKGKYLDVQTTEKVLKDFVSDVPARYIEKARKELLKLKTNNKLLGQKVVSAEEKAKKLEQAKADKLKSINNKIDKLLKQKMDKFIANKKAKTGYDPTDFQISVKTDFYKKKLEDQFKKEIEKINSLKLRGRPLVDPKIKQAAKEQRLAKSMYIKDLKNTPDSPYHQYLADYKNAITNIPLSKRDLEKYQGIPASRIMDVIKTDKLNPKTSGYLRYSSGIEKVPHTFSKGVNKGKEKLLSVNTKYKQYKKVTPEEKLLKKEEKAKLLKDKKAKDIVIIGYDPQEYKYRRDIGQLKIDPKTSGYRYRTDLGLDLPKSPENPII